MTVSPIDVIARADGFETAAAGRALRPWEWTFIHAVDGHMQLREVAELCGLDLALATNIVVEQSAAGILRVVTMTLDDYRVWSGLGTDLFRATAEVAPEAAAGVSVAPAADVAPAFASLQREPEAAVAEADHVAFAGETIEQEPIEQEPFEPEPFEPRPVASVPAWPEVWTPEPFEPEPFEPEPFAPEPFAPEQLTPEQPASELFAHELFTTEPFMSEPSGSVDSVQEPFAHEPFAHEPFANEPFSHESSALEAVAAEPPAGSEPVPAAKGVNFSFDSFDELATLESEPVKGAATAAPEGISLSFEPGDQPMAEPEPISSGGGVSLSFDPDSSLLEPVEAHAFEAGQPATPAHAPATNTPAAYASPAAPLPAFEVAAESPEASGAPINLSFSSDGFPILTPVAPPESMRATTGAPAPFAASSATPAAPGPITSQVPPTPPVADVPSQAPARVANTSIDDPADIVGSLIARVLSIRIK